MAVEYRWDNFRLDLDAYRLERAGAPLSLEPKAFNLLVLMIRRPDHLFSKQEIFEAIWPDTAVTDHALTRIVAQLRRTLGDEAREARYIETVPTRGYRWIRPLEQGPAPAPPGAEASPAFATLASQAAATPSPAPPRDLTPWLTAVLTAAAVVTLAAWIQRAGGSNASATNPPTSDWPASTIARPVQVTTHNGLDLNPALSPQGDALAYASDRSGALELYVRATSGAAAESPLTADGGQNVQPAWSPDARFIAYHSNRFGGIWIVPPAAARRGRWPRPVPTLPGRPTAS